MSWCSYCGGTGYRYPEENRGRCPFIKGPGHGSDDEEEDDIEPPPEEDESYHHERLEVNPVGDQFKEPPG